MVSLLYRLVDDDDDDGVVEEEVTVAGVVNEASSNVVDAVSAGPDVPSNVPSDVSPVVEDIAAPAASII